ncbi:MAG: heat shock protein HtpX [Verrucomicrobiaceae bacterium]|nr:heat shock protein HtpX [Verrucomicrobiaceae bacterium]
MPSSSPLIIKESATHRSACGAGLLFVRVEHLVTAIVIGLMPVLYCLVSLAIACLAIWHAHLTVKVINFGHSFGPRDGLLVLAVFGEAIGTVLLVRQLFTPHVTKPVRMELLQGDQPELFEAIRLVSEKVCAPVPTKVVVDSTAGIGADFDSCMDAVRGRRLRLNIGLCLVVGVSAQELAALLAHELAFFSAGSGTKSAKFIRGVHQWFLLRIQHDPWMDWLNDRSKEADKLKRWALRFLWAILWLALRPLRLLYAVCRLFTAGMMRSMVCRADACAARLAGSGAMAGALEKQGVLSTLYSRAHREYLEGAASLRLPDNLPLLMSRRLMIDTVGAEDLPQSSHWLEMALPDAKRRAQILKLNAEGMISATGDATSLFRNFHELARRGTYFHYQNTHGLAISEHRLVAVEETVHDSRASMQTVEVLNHYFKGLAHPERAFCGIAEELGTSRDSEVLRMELQDCREWLEKYGERMAAALKEWGKTWRLVRDLQTAYVLTRASIPVNRHQFCVSHSTPEAFLEEIERQRHIMDNMEGVLRQYEGRLETRLASSLELLWRADPRTLPPALMAVKDTLPHWVLIYEALGLNLPLLRELMTHFHAFQSLGATLSGMVSSASYVMTMQATMPAMARLLSDILVTIGQWPYPFKVGGGEHVMSLADFVAPNAHLLDLADLLDPSKGAVQEGQSMVLAQVRAKRLCEVVAPFIDNYLALYHQSFAWVSKASEMAEALLFNPFETDREKFAAACAKTRQAPEFMAGADPKMAHAGRLPALAA